ncbi:MAG: type I polyketide synthase, partial [Ktedonobacteraceae bacterium]
MTNSTAPDTSYDTALAIIGLAGRFPGATNVELFWQNVARGVKSIRFFSDAELLAAGVEPTLLRHPNYVKAGAILEDSDRFDAAFFGYTRREAEVMDPQHRLFMECAWEALEDAAYNLETCNGLVGVFAGSSFSTYLSNNLHHNDRLKELVSQLQIDLGNEHDSLASAVSYKLNLKGPSVALQTFCSTSLVAVHMACQSLFTYECDMALAGGVAVATPQVKGYLYEEGGILSPDGECRAFDARGQGSVMGNGAGVVVLKRFHEAVEDGDHIYAIIRGSAINNDGGTRVSYTAPGLNGQKEVIAEAVGHAGVSVETISYLEAHGTATKLGDAIELAAMIKAFDAQTRKKRFCAIGSVKPNVGHLDRASGVTGLIKTTLALKYKQLPPSLNFERTHPDIDLDNSPFYVNTALRDWPASQDDTPRRAGVSSFGLGGTNAHVILEEAPECEPPALARPWQLLLLSAKTATALDTMTANLAAHLRTYHTLPLADVAYTLQVGRSAFNHRRMLVCRNREEAINVLETLAVQREDTRHQTCADRPVAFLFPATTEQNAGLLQELYEQEPTFRETVDQCRAFLKMHLGRTIELRSPELAQITCFIFAYALAQLLDEWGVRPRAMSGSGLGEYVAGCLAGVFSLEDALMLVVCHTQLRQEPAPPITLHEPRIPLISGVTGTWITDQQVTDQQYWVQHAGYIDCYTNGVECLLRETEHVLLEVGAGQCFTGLVERPPACSEERARDIFSALPPLHTQQSGQAFLLTALGRLWLAGVSINWTGFYAHERRLRVSLPTYPFERERYWIDPPERAALPAQRAKPARGKKPDIADWFYLPTWRQMPCPDSIPQQARELCSLCLVFVDDCGIGEQVASRLAHSGCRVVRVRAGEQFALLEKDVITIRPRERDDYQALCRSLAAAGQFPTTILHCWSITPEDETATGAAAFRTLQETGFYSLLFLAQALGSPPSSAPVRIVAVSNGVQVVTNQEWTRPEKAPLLGACKVIAQEYLHITCRSVDLSLSGYPGSGVMPDVQLTDLLLAELSSGALDPVVAYRNGQRWIQTYEVRRLETVGLQASRLRPKGVYLITGGLGKVGLMVAAYLARTAQARLVLLSRSALPERDAWETWLESHDDADRVSRTIRQIQDIEARGGEVLLLSADVADEARMREAIQSIYACFGELHGVIHAAGISDERAFGLAQQIERETCERHFQPKVYGTWTLEKVLQGHNLDFCVLFSSISSVLGGLGFAAYA